MSRRILLVILLLGSAFTRAEVVSFAQFDVEYPPLQQYIDGELKGPDIELVKEIFRRTPQYQLDITQMPIARSFKAFVDGEVDTVLSFATGKFKNDSIYLDRQIRQSSYRLITLASESRPYQSWRDLSGKRLATLRIVTLPLQVQPAIDLGKAELRRVARHEQLLHMLERRRVDVIYMYYDIALHYANKLGVEISAMPGAPTENRDFFLGISIKSPLLNKSKLQAELSKSLDSMYLDGTQAEILKRYGIVNAASD
ncbi:transporter substrate-binding domain-containing protein [uncultured Pseudoteredinibacter sp.]|uniref:substrate-binding periplasmic protein n=1 Tax=uncultured Pseudoteredinibacter sp. TaxID=1641701 RepID=UPI00261D5E21|nr:transporter substrate-binding domain-containing protein [uncultured Pseudoteredinibacter sp.]